MAVADALLIWKAKDERRHKFICFTGGVFALERHLRRRIANLTSSQNDCIPRLFCPIPSPITIHRKIAADHGQDLRPARL